MSENMIFCLGGDKYDSEGEGYQKNYRVFNKQVTKEEYEKIYSSLSNIKMLPTQWIDENKMTSEEKKSVKIAKDLGGYLKTFTYEEAWSNFWEAASKEQKDAILNIPQFDAEIFKEITGLDVEKVSSDEQAAMELLKKNGYKIIKV